MPVKSHYCRTANMRFNKILLVLVIQIVSIPFCYANSTARKELILENPPRSFTGSNFPAPQFPQWVDDKTGRILFDVDDIVRFDWEKQIFELSRRRAMDLMAHSVRLSHPFTVKDDMGIIYHGTFMSMLSSMSYDGPTITIDGHDKKNRPPLFKIDSSYPARSVKTDKRYSERLKTQLTLAGVPGKIDTDKPPKPINRKTSGWHGEKDHLRLWIEYFPETFRLGDNARIHLHVIPGKRSKNRANRIEFNINLKQNDDEFTCSTYYYYTLRQTNWRNVYVWETAPWYTTIDSALQSFANTGPAKLEIQAKTFNKENRALIIEKIEIPPIPITILPGKLKALYHLDTIRSLTQKAIDLPVCNFRPPGKYDQNTIGLDLSKILKATNQWSDVKYFTLDNRYFQQNIQELVVGHRYWALAALLDHPNIDAKISAAKVLVELQPYGLPPILLAAAKSNNYPVNGSENATLHSIYRKILKDGLEKATGLKLTPKGLKVITYPQPGQPNVIRSEDDPSYFQEKVDFAQVEQWLTKVYLSPKISPDGSAPQ